jgi:hypothetical protein
MHKIEGGKALRGEARAGPGPICGYKLPRKRSKTGGGPAVKRKLTFLEVVKKTALSGADNTSAAFVISESNILGGGACHASHDGFPHVKSRCSTIMSAV